MEFMIGCNYWASNAGAEMWRLWDEKAIENDLKILSSHGIKYMRVFPNWRDFQPVEPIFKFEHNLSEYALNGDSCAQNPYYLDEDCLERFEIFCDMCEKYKINLIVGILTGWMSGRLFIPPALFGKNLYTDHTALYFEQLFVEGFVKRMKNKKAIYAWDLGNECNCMDKADDRYIAASWSHIISNAIRAADPSRHVISGMHSLAPDDFGKVWTIEDQAAACDMLTTHPYPYFVPHAYKDSMLSFRTLMHAQCETKFYADISHKPCLVEEIGTLGNMMCSEENAAKFMRINLFSAWAHGSPGLLWWCANDQTNLSSIPYTRNMIETELGMIDINHNPKPVLKETKKISEIIGSFDFALPKASEDAVFITSMDQDSWGSAYMSFCLAKQAGLNMRFCSHKEPLPDSDIYMLPSITGSGVINRQCYDEIRKRVFDGATLYISGDGGILSEFEELCGIKVETSGRYNDKRAVDFYGASHSFTRSVRHVLSESGAQILAYDSEGDIAISKNKYGKGSVFYVNFPLEIMLLDENDAFDDDRYLIYKGIFENKINSHPVLCDNKNIGVTFHESNLSTYIVAINYSDKKQKTNFELNEGINIKEILYGNIDTIKPFDALIFKIEKN